MADLLVRRLPEDVKDRLKAKAERHGRSLESEARAILVEASTMEDFGAPPERSLAEEFAEAFKGARMTDAERDEFESSMKSLWTGSKLRPAKLGR